MHGRVLMAMPGSALRLQAWLGPLQELPVDGRPDLRHRPARRRDATARDLPRRRRAPGRAGRLAPAVDAVLGEQVRRLKAFIETGKPE